MCKLKLNLLTLFLILICSLGYAEGRTVSSVIVPTTTLDADPTSASGTKEVRSADKIACIVSYDETQVGGISATVTVDVSEDGVTWLDASFYDYAGGATLQTSESLTSDSNYYFWFNRDLAMPYVRVVIAATGSDADDTAIVSAKLIVQG